jgi:CRISPR-associated protein Cmr5
MPNTPYQSKLEQGRASKAFELADACKKILNKPEKIKEYGNYAKKAPMLIKSSGLGAALAFMQAKGATEAGKNWKYLLADITNWLKASENKFSLVPPNTPDLIKFIIEQDSSIYRALTTEVLAFLSWYRRFV